MSISNPERIDQCPTTPPTPDRLTGSKPPEGRSSPPPNCAICLGRCKNKCFTDSCLHKFCFKCLLEWSKVKAECPLCKQSFKSIIHNVKSIDQFEEYLVQPQQQPSYNQIAQRSDSDGQQLIANRFDMFISLPRYRNGYANYNIYSENVFHSYFLPRQPSYSSDRVRYPHDPAVQGNIAELWRQYIYDRRLYALPVVDITGRYRECSARFYRNNPAQVHRLLPWLNRDLICLLRNSQHQTGYVFHNISELLNVYNINSAEFRKRCMVYLGSRTSHFIHEFLTFARSPYDMHGYDRQAHYAPYEEMIISSSSNTSSASESEDGNDRNRLPRHTNNSNTENGSVNPVNNITTENLPNMSESDASTTQFVHRFPIASISENIVLSSGSSSECEFVMEQKPPHLRTPELVSLNSKSDSDVVFVGESKSNGDAGSSKVIKKLSKSSVRNRLRRETSHYNNLSSSSDDEERAMSRVNERKYKKSENVSNPDNTSKSENPQDVAQSTTNDTVANDETNQNNDNEYNNGASTSVDASYLNKFRRKLECPRHTYGRKRKNVKSIFESSSSDEDTKKQYNDKFKTDDDDDYFDNFDTTDFYQTPESDSDDSSWSKSRNSRYQKRHKLSKRRRSELSKKRLKKKSKKI